MSDFKQTHIKFIAYAGIVLVVLIWGSVPPTVSYLFNFYSAAVYTGINSFFAAIALLLMSIKKLKLLSREYFKLAIPTGIFNSIAALLQKIGLQYTTPTKYAFLENLSCLVVPILLFILVKKKPGILTVIACAVCLTGSFVLSGVSFSGDSGFGIGEILCALAGCCYGVNIAVTGTYAKKLEAPLYVMIQIWIQCIISFAIAVVLNFITVDGAPMERFVISFNVWHVLAILAVALISTALGWTIRTNAMKHVSANAVAIIMPFSAVVTAILSVSLGMDTLSPNLVIGAILGLAAAILSSLDDILEGRRAARALEEEAGAKEQKITT